MKPIKKIAMYNNYPYYWREGDLHTNFGLIKEDEIKDGKVLSNTKKKFSIFTPNFMDLIPKIKRGPQTLLPKDLAIITTYASISKDSLVVDAGTGCGLLAIFMAKQAKKVVTYEKEEKHIKIAKKNIEFFNQENIEIKNKNIYDGIDEDNIDILTLDLPAPWKILPYAKEKLKYGGTIVTYLPSITQVSQFVESLDENFTHIKTVEILEREWHVEGKKLRPKSQMQAHTAFLTFIRKI